MPGSAVRPWRVTQVTTEQQKALEFMLFDLSACASPDDAPPPPPPPSQ